MAGRGRFIQTSDRVGCLRRKGASRGLARDRSGDTDMGDRWRIRRGWHSIQRLSIMVLLDWWAGDSLGIWRTVLGNICGDAGGSKRGASICGVADAEGENWFDFRALVICCSKDENEKEAI